MTCEEYQMQVSEYIDGELDDAQSGALFKHLSTCAECRSFLRSTLELRSKIHDEMLMEQASQTQIFHTKNLSFSFLLPLAALILSLLLVFEVADQPQKAGLFPTNQPQYFSPYANPPMPPLAR